MSPWLGSSSAQRRTNRSATPNTGLGPSLTRTSLPAVTADPHLEAAPLGGDHRARQLIGAISHNSAVRRNGADHFRTMVLGVVDQSLPQQGATALRFSVPIILASAVKAVARFTR